MSINVELVVLYGVKITDPELLQDEDFMEFAEKYGVYDGMSGEYAYIGHTEVHEDISYDDPLYKEIDLEKFVRNSFNFVLNVFEDEKFKRFHYIVEDEYKTAPNIHVFKHFS